MCFGWVVGSKVAGVPESRLVVAQSCDKAKVPQAVLVRRSQNIGCVHADVLEAVEDEAATEQLASTSIRITECQLLEPFEFRERHGPGRWTKARRHRWPFVPPRDRRALPIQKIKKVRPRDGAKSCIRACIGISRILHESNDKNRSLICRGLCHRAELRLAGCCSIVGCSIRYGIIRGGHGSIGSRSPVHVLQQRNARWGLGMVWTLPSFLHSLRHDSCSLLK